MEGQITLETVARRVGNFELVGEPGYRENFVLRGLSKLPVAFKERS
jgi:hypothetical protein